MIQEEEHSPGISQAVLDPKNVPIDALDKEVALLVNFLLLKYQMKEPITKADMLEIVIKDCQVHFPEILLRASECLEMIFHLDLKEVDPANHHYCLLIRLALPMMGSCTVKWACPRLAS